MSRNSPNPPASETPPPPRYINRGTLGVLIVVLGLTALSALRGWVSMGMEGPYHGESVELPAGTSPDITAPLPDSARYLAVFEDVADADAPVVALIGEDGEPVWAVAAVAGPGAPPIERLAFQSMRRWPVLGLRARGWVGTDAGLGSALWILDDEGELKAYWFRLP